jgi:hypothetical protein
MARICKRLIRLNVDAHVGGALTSSELAEMVGLPGGQGKRPIYTILGVARASGALEPTPEGNLQWAKAIDIFPADSSWHLVHIVPVRRVAGSPSGGVMEVTRKIMSMRMPDGEKSLEPAVVAALLRINARRAYEALKILSMFGLWELAPPSRVGHKSRAYSPTKRAREVTVMEKRHVKPPTSPERTMLTRSQKRRAVALDAKRVISFEESPAPVPSVLEEPDIPFPLLPPLEDAEFPGLPPLETVEFRLPDALAYPEFPAQVMETNWLAT